MPRDSPRTSYTAEDLSKEIQAILSRLECPIRPDGSDELSQNVDDLLRSRHEAGDDVAAIVRRAQEHIDGAEAARLRASEVLKQYAHARFPSAIQRGGMGALESPRLVLVSPPPPPPPPYSPQSSIAEEDSNSDEKAAFAEIAAAKRKSASDFAERMRPVLEKVRDWLGKFVAELLAFINMAAGQSRQWMIEHSRQIDAVFIAFSVLTSLFGTQIAWLLPIVDVLTGGAATPTWFAVQFGILTAKTAWGIIKGDKNHELNRKHAKEQGFAFAVGLVDLFASQLPTPPAPAGYASQLGAAMVKSGLKLIEGPDDGESNRKFALKQTFGFAVDVAGVFKSDIFKEGRLPVALGGLIEMRSRKGLAKDIYNYAKLRADWAQTRRQISAAPRTVPKEEWRQSREGRVRRWLLDRGEPIEGGILRISTMKTLFGHEITEIVNLVDGFTGGNATRAWIGIQLGVSGANFAWRIVRGDRHGAITKQHIQCQLFSAGVDVLNIFSGHLGLGEHSRMFELANSVQFVNEWLGYTRRYVYSGGRRNSDRRRR